MSSIPVSGMSGNEAFCLREKGYRPGDLVVGNSVCSLGVLGGLGAMGRGLAGGEVANVTSLISEGRHQAIERMEKEAERQGAQGVTSVVSELRTLASYMEFLAQGTAVHGPPGPREPFSTAASGMEMYCHLDAGYRPIRFAMGNVAFALGIGRGLMGSVRTMGRGEVHEFSQMYNHIRHLALDRLRKEAASLGANAVVDVKVRMLPYGPGGVELLMTGTASFQARLPASPRPEQVVTSELTGEELWNLAAMGLVPVQLCMATSVYSLGVVGGIGSRLRGIGRGELPALTRLVYEARENCLDLVRKEAARFGCRQVVGNKLSIRELSPGLIEVIAVGTGVSPGTGVEPTSERLIPQAIIVDSPSLDNDLAASGVVEVAAYGRQRVASGGQRLVGCVVAMVMMGIAVVGSLVAALVAGFSNRF